MTIAERLKVHREEILRLAEQYKAYNVRIFGSIARGVEREDSDLDVLVSRRDRMSLFDWVGLEHDLEDLLGCQVDVVIEGGTNKPFEARILTEAVPL